MMNIFFFISGILAFIAGLAHSFLGERFFIPRFKIREQKLDVGTERFVNRTLRSVWHLFTLASWSTAALLIVFAFRELDDTTVIVARIISNFFLLSGVLSIFISHARQLIWLVFFIMSLLSWIGTYTY